MSTEPVQMELFTKPELAEVRPYWIEMITYYGSPLPIVHTQEELIQAQAQGRAAKWVGPTNFSTSHVMQYTAAITNFLERRDEMATLYYKLEEQRRGN